MKSYELKDDGRLFVDGLDMGMVKKDHFVSQIIRHLESEISKKDDEIKGLREVIHNYEQFGKAEIEASKEPFIFTKDTPVRIENGEVELFWENKTFVIGRRKINGTNHWVEGKWYKTTGVSGYTADATRLIPILPEKRVVDVWVCVPNEGYLTNIKLSKDQANISVEYCPDAYSHIEHHQIELKGQSNV